MERERIVSICEDEDEEYIEMELSSSSASIEFEFQMPAATASPADHLFHKGKLLPLYLLPSTPPESDDDFFFELNTFIHHHPTPKISSPKAKKRSILAHKLKAYLKSLFLKSGKHKPSADTARRSFSSAVKRVSSSSSNSSCVSASSSFSLSQDLQCLRRTSSATETEGSIEAAIAHCKKSHHIF
ncbi:probable membrane-associated kinase regulator 3 [Salvia miltiorrhiza]|uniref:probable membrane-associated kinase regulator 3 n=1 Tax=Salvia miltiorrhiza TaxID=226208 RepID=UPI0025AB623C|nr:probable membrane-associated kinase regulator 3 [Salvia miltiorrhiza]